MERASSIAEACQRIPPLWPLGNFVAVNPFAGLSHLAFDDAARLLERVSHGAVLMSGAYYLEQLRNGAIGPDDIRTALRRYGSAVDPVDPCQWLEEQLGKRAAPARMLTVADFMDESRGSAWGPFVVDEISKWCSSYFDQGQSAWPMPWKHLPLYEAWRLAAQEDVNPEVAGWKGFRRHVRELPEQADEAIGQALRMLQVPSGVEADFLHRQLMSVYGWSAYCAYQDRQGQHTDGAVRQLLAIRLAYDTALFPMAGGRWRCETSTATEGGGGFTAAKYIAQLALEHGFRSKLASKLTVDAVSRVRGSRPQLQAVFCIDVRSERMRRALEAQAPDIETIGFAGFFGIPLAVSSSARCPVLISPSHRVEVSRAVAWPGKVASGAGRVWKSLSQSAAACFQAVEVGGAWFGMRLIERQFASAGAAKAERREEALRWSIPIAELASLAAGALRNMSLDLRRLAPLVLLCGHGSSTENNPYGSSLDCGACGGHKGDVNARFAAAVLNDPEVRKELAARGMTIPDDTYFAAGLHNTTTDEIELYANEIPDSHVVRMAQVRALLQGAARAVRQERGRTLLGPGATQDPVALEREVRRRGGDWSEVRPEWGLAGNAAFLAVPRSRTKALHLDGRAFLHDYDPIADGDGSVLELILTAPLIVASWINLQYYASTVNNELYGSGNKVLHNVVGGFGVWEGNAGDLRTGLPLQCLHDGSRWVHEPLRLQVVIDAPRERIDRILRKHSGLRRLVENNWIHLMALDEYASLLYECDGVGSWRLMPAR